MGPQSSLAMCSLDIHPILRAITLATMLAIKLATMSAIMLVTRLGSTLAATSTTLLLASTTSCPTQPPNTLTLATLDSGSRRQPPRTRLLPRVPAIIENGNRHLSEKQ